MHGSWKDGCWGSEWKPSELWHGVGYSIRLPYKEGQPINTDDPAWHFANELGQEVELAAPQEFKHTLSTVINGLIGRGFQILRFEEYTNDSDDPEAKIVGSWNHYVSIAAPWFYLWAARQ